MKYGILCVLITLVYVLNIHGQTIDYKNIPLEESFKLAKTEGKWVFVFFSSTNSEACKTLDIELNGNDEVVGYFNSKFISVKIELDSENHLSKKYKVGYIPTLLFLDEKGKELKRMEGFVSGNRLLHNAMILTGDSPSFEELWKIYRKNKEDIDVMQRLLLEATLFLQDINDPRDYQQWQERVNNLSRDYFKMKPLSDLLNENDFILIMSYAGVPSKNNNQVDFIIDNLPEFLEIVPFEVLSNFLVGYTTSLVNKMAMDGDPDYKKVVSNINGVLKPVFEPILNSGLPIEYMYSTKADAIYSLFGQKDQEKYIEIMSAYLERMGDLIDANEFFSTIMNLMEAAGNDLTEDSARKCLVWVSKLSGFELNVNTNIDCMVVMGDCYLKLANISQAKLSYEAAYMLSLQTDDLSKQLMIQRKLKELQ